MLGRHVNFVDLEISQTYLPYYLCAKRNIQWSDDGQAILGGRFVTMILFAMSIPSL